MQDDRRVAAQKIVCETQFRTFGHGGMPQIFREGISPQKNIAAPDRFGSEKPVPESDDNLRLEIRHVLFIDIVGYSKLLIEEQKERLGQLTSIVLGTAQVRDSSDEQLVRLPTGDGMASVFRHSPEEPAHLRAGSRRSAPEAPGTSGADGHSQRTGERGDRRERADQHCRADINMAQRVMDCGDAGHIFLSQQVSDNLVQIDRIGNVYFKNSACAATNRGANLIPETVGHKHAGQNSREFGS